MIILRGSYYDIIVVTGTTKLARTSLGSTKATRLHTWSPPVAHATATVPIVRCHFHSVRSVVAISLLPTSVMLTIIITIVLTATSVYSAQYTNEFAVRVAGGNIKHADRLARKHGFINRGQVSVLLYYDGY